ncbi:MAG: hypothetical protein ACYDAQ_01790 [Mycobacteriales bacterium]
MGWLINWLTGAASGGISAVLGAIGRAIRAGIADLTGWMFARMIDALQATTAVHLSGWFDTPWRAMLSVAAVVALPLLLVGVAREVLAGNPAGAAYRGLAMPALIGVGLIAARAVLAGLLALVDFACLALVTAALGGVGGYGEALAHVEASLGVIGPGLPSTPVVVTVLLLVVAGVLAFVIWIELAVRAALLYLLAVMIPLAAAGLFFRHTASWTRRLADVTVAIALSKLVITAVMVLAAAALSASSTSLAGGVGSAAVGIALLLLGSFGLPMTLRVVPHVTEAAVAAGTGALVAGRLRSGATQAGAQVAAAAGPTPIGFAAAALAGPAAISRLAGSASRAAAAPAHPAAGGAARAPEPRPAPPAGGASHG